MADIRGCTVQLCTFEKWGVGDDIGRETVVVEGRTLVKKVWCKLCAKYIDRLLADPRIRGRAIHECQVYVHGTTSVTKHNVLRHKCSVVGVYFKTNKLVSTPPNTSRP